MPASFPARPTPPLPAHVWHAHALAGEAMTTVDTAYAALNAVLPGGGWPVGALVELLQVESHSEWSLLAPALARLDRSVVLVGAPYQPFGPALAAHRLDPSRLLWVQAGSATAQLWAAEQALRCADVAAVLAWLPRVQMAPLRRLHIAAQEHGKLLFVFRHPKTQLESSPAPLRIRLARLPGPLPLLRLDVFKRRGPPLQVPLDLALGPPRLKALLAASRAQAQGRQHAAWPQENMDALDRFVATA